MCVLKNEPGQVLKAWPVGTHSKQFFNVHSILNRGTKSTHFICFYFQYVLCLYINTFITMALCALKQNL